MIGELKPDMGSPKTPEKNTTQDWTKWKSAWDKLSEDEKHVLQYIQYSFSGRDEHKLSQQDELEKSAKEKLSKAGFDDYENYLEVKK